MRSLFQVVLFVSLLLPLSVHAKNNILFILDGSNSMWGQIDGEAKISSAQGVLGALLKDLPSDTNVGFMTYGHREEGSCDDIEVLAGVGESSTDALIGKINALKPKGKTPIASALQKSMGELSKFAGDNNSVVLISDGVETCGGDPCSAAKALADAGIKARVHVVGFDVGKEERKQLQCIPDMGNGKYFSASNTEELKLAVAEVKKEAVVIAPPAKPIVWFEDNFDGDNLAEHWEVRNPNPDSYIVENGKLVVISSLAANITEEKAENTFYLAKGMPDGNWDAMVKLVPEIQTNNELMYLSYMRDGKNQLAAMIEITMGGCCYNAAIKLHGLKYLKGESTTFERMLYTGPNGNWDEVKRMKWFGDNVRGIILKISKRGRSYVISSKIEGDLTTKDGKKPEWLPVHKLTSLRAPGTNLILAFPQKAATNGESIIKVDWVKVLTIPND